MKPLLRIFHGIKCNFNSDMRRTVIWAASLLCLTAQTDDGNQPNDKEEKAHEDSKNT